jgi:hypothetical protein
MKLLRGNLMRKSIGEEASRRGNAMVKRQPAEEMEWCSGQPVEEMECEEANC